MPRSAPLAHLHDARLHFVRWGSSGPRVLLIHAVGFDHRTWEPVLPYLADEFELVAPDLPGHGASEKPANADYGLRSLGARMIGFLDELGWEDAIVVGNSIGGGTALSLAIQAPERVRALALINSVGLRSGLPLLGRLAFLPLVPLVASYSPLIAIRLGLEFARCARGTLSADRCALSSQYLRSPEGRASFFATLRQLYGQDLAHMAESYGQIRCPTLILHGEQDPLIRVRHARALAGEIPNSKLVLLPRCGHFSQEECPVPVANNLRAFLEQVCAKNASASSVQS
jgi:pimeloyl-ACP methyl ester carboxylesterase